MRGEIEQFVNAFTVNETYFYREEHQLACLTADLLAARIRDEDARRPDPNLVRALLDRRGTVLDRHLAAGKLAAGRPATTSRSSAPTSTPDAVELARAGVYGKRALMRLPPHLIEKYFEPDGSETWKILDDLRESVHVHGREHRGAGRDRAHGQFDVIFCRNVLIYFDDTSRRIAAENLYENLLPGGFICLGHTESMSRISPLVRGGTLRRRHRVSDDQRCNEHVADDARKRVLVVDDASLVRLYYRAALESAGFQVDEALNGLEALEQVLADARRPA